MSEENNVELEVLKKESEIFKLIELEDQHKMVINQIVDAKQKLYQELIQLREKLPKPTKDQ
jgi:hypothetical protein